MYSQFVRPLKSYRYLAVVIVVLGCICLAVAGDTKKASSSGSAAKPAAAPAKPATGAASHPASGGAATHGASTSGTHGATTSGATHGPTTSNPGGAKTTTTTGSRTTTSGTRTTTASGTKTTTTSGTRTTTTSGTKTPTSVKGTTQPTVKGPATGGRTGTTAAASRPVPAGSATHTTAKGNAVTTRPGGKVSDVHVANKNMDIHHGLSGNRRVETVRADHSRVVAERGGRGYVERGYRYNGRDYGRRSYYYHGRYYNHYYRGYYYHGYYAPVYAPAYYYGPAYYGWAYNPWPAPIVYTGWGWSAYPWYGYYGPYFAPYPVYASATFWLTDYLLAKSLEDAYQQQVDAQVAATALPPGQTVMTPEVKEMISEEVKRQIALENAEAQQNAQNQEIDPASSGIGRMLSDNQTHVFIAGSDLDVVQTSGQECAISQGDVLEVTSAPPAAATAATATVLCSKGGKECPKSSQVNIAFTDLQEMQNHMRASIDQGLSDLQSKQGQGGLPSAPPSAQVKPVQSAFVAAAPPAETNVAADITQQSKEADQAEKEVAMEAPASGGPNPGSVEGGSPAPAPASASAKAPVSISQGQTVDEVVAQLGQPKSVVDLGAKKIYVYPDMKITFRAGKVSDVQ